MLVDRLMPSLMPSFTLVTLATLATLSSKPASRANSGGDTTWLHLIFFIIPRWAALDACHIIPAPPASDTPSHLRPLHYVSGGWGKGSKSRLPRKDRFYTAIWKPGGMEINFRKVYCSDVIPLSPTQKATTFFFKQLKWYIISIFRCKQCTGRKNLDDISRQGWQRNGKLDSKA